MQGAAAAIPGSITSISEKKMAAIEKGFLIYFRIIVPSHILILDVTNIVLKKYFKKICKHN